MRSRIKPAAITAIPMIPPTFSIWTTSKLMQVAQTNAITAVKPKRLRRDHCVGGGHPFGVDSISGGGMASVIVPLLCTLLFSCAHFEQEETETTELEMLLRSLCCLLFDE
jgi:hypothetical protein